MGPVTIFDKSFLQSLSVDESVWFDNFYLANISPLFYIETLADLAKEMGKGRPPDQIVGEIASKTPEMGGSPNIHHMDLLINNLLGQKIVMDGRPILAGGTPVVSGEKKGVAFGVSPEAKAFSRWQNREYMEIERDFAKQWRTQIKTMTFESSQSYAEKLCIDITQCKNINDAYAAAQTLVNSNSRPYDLMEFILTAFAIPRELHHQIIHRYQVSCFQPLNSYAPYVAHVIKVEVFFHICILRGFISSERPSNKIDIAYLHYLPFCKLFVSGDNLHKRISPLFMRKDQLFVWGPDLKADLTALNNFYMELPQESKDKGILSFARKPPIDGDFLTSKLWDLMGTEWRRPREIEYPLFPESSDQFLNQMRNFTEAPLGNPDYADFDIDKLDAVSLQRFVTKKKGSWFQVPKNLKDS